MISTVTTTVTTVTATMASSFALIVTLILLSLLIQKEVVSVSVESRSRHLNRAMTILIVPLGMVFLAITAVEILKVL